MRFIILPILLAVGALASCTPPLVPPDYSGPTAIIRDKAEAHSSTQIFYYALWKVDGGSVDNSSSISREMNYGQGLTLTPRQFQREVPIRPMVLTLKAGNQFGADIQALFSKDFSVTGTTNFTPKPGKLYTVNGSVTETTISVWLEDENGRKLSQVFSAPR